jgi:hypothetical protein
MPGRDRSTDHVRQRVGRTHLVEVHLFGGDAMHRGFSIGKQPEGVGGYLGGSGLQPCRADDRQHIGQTSEGRWTGRCRDHRAGTSQPAAPGPFDVDVHIRHTQGGDRSAYRSKVGTGIDQRPEQHVARHACGAVQVRGPWFNHRAPARRS